MSGSIALTVSYNGSGLAGFARQPGLVTVQGEIERALGVILRRDVEIVGAGRTDAGVHALGQVVSFEADGVEPEPTALLRSLNALTDERVVVTGVRRAAAGFSARHSAVAREYRYRIVPGPVPPLFLAPYAWWVPAALEIPAMRDAAVHLIGEHDFRSFCVTASAHGQRTVRRIEAIEIVPEVVLGEHSLTVRVVGNAFLHSMVRVIVGSIAEVGSRRHDASWMAEALGARDRASAGPTAPAGGLTLWHVSYPEECWL